MVEMTKKNREITNKIILQLSDLSHTGMLKAMGIAISPQTSRKAGKKYETTISDTGQ